MTNPVRQAFIAWARAHGYAEVNLGRTPADGFVGSYVEAAWEAWQASRAAALEDAAGLCDEDAADARAVGQALVASALVGAAVDIRALAREEAR